MKRNPCGLLCDANQAQSLVRVRRLMSEQEYALIAVADVDSALFFNYPYRSLALHFNENFVRHVQFVRQVEMAVQYAIAGALFYDQNVRVHDSCSANIVGETISNRRYLQCTPLQ